MKSHNDDQTKIGDRPELDEEEIIPPDIVYPIKHKDDTTSLLVIFVDDIDEIQDTIDTIGNIIEPVMEPLEQLVITITHEATEAPVIQSSVDIHLPPEKEHQVENQLPPIKTD